eukprot:TRINITY_DN426_c0_g1_i6.p1 TRINITY_DN426_c0_g1~~TRINITY_DN426_c0_g1_i6.p1  ORF type:complete len:1310 (-),score=266.30 TRINITY_DN426_c0_g1_i6:1007-4936(-)
MCIRDSINAEYGDFDCGQMTPRQCAGAIAASLMLGLVVADPVCDLVNNNQHHSNHDNGGYSKITNWCQDMNLAELGAWGSKVNATAIADGIPTRAGDPPWPVTCNYNLRWGHGPPYMVGSSGDLSLNARPYTVYQASNDPDGQPLRANLTCSYEKLPDQVHVLDKFNMGCAGFPVPVPPSLDGWFQGPGLTYKLVEEEWNEVGKETALDASVDVVNVLNEEGLIKRPAFNAFTTEEGKLSGEEDLTRKNWDSIKYKGLKVFKPLTLKFGFKSEGYDQAGASSRFAGEFEFGGVLAASLGLLEGVFGDAASLTELFATLIDWAKELVNGDIEQLNVDLAKSKIHNVILAFRALEDASHVLTSEQWVTRAQRILLGMDLSESDLFLSSTKNFEGTVGAQGTSAAISFVSQWASLYMVTAMNVFNKQPSTAALRAFALGVNHWARTLQNYQKKLIQQRVELIKGDYCIQDTYGEGMQSMTLSHQHLDNSKVAAGYVTTLYKDVIGRTWRDFLSPIFSDIATKWVERLAKFQNRFYYRSCPRRANQTLAYYGFYSALIADRHDSWDAARVACSNDSSCLGYGINNDNNALNPVSTFKINATLLEWGDSVNPDQIFNVTRQCSTAPGVGLSATRTFFGCLKYRAEINLITIPDLPFIATIYNTLTWNLHFAYFYLGRAAAAISPWCRGINTSSLSTWIASVNTSEIELGIFAQPSAPRPTCQLDLLLGYGAASFDRVFQLASYTLHSRSTYTQNGRHTNRTDRSTIALNTTTRTWKIACYGHNLSVSDYNMNCAGFPVPPPNLIHSWHHGPPSIGLLVSESLKSVSAGVRVEVGIQLEDQVGAEAEAALSRLFEHVPRSEALQKTLEMLEAVFGQDGQVSVSFQALTGWAGEFLGIPSARNNRHDRVYAQISYVQGELQRLQQTSSFLTNSSWASRARQILLDMELAESRVFLNAERYPTTILSFQSQWASMYLSTSLELYQKQPTFENLRLLGRDVYRWGQLLRKSQLELLQRRLAQIRSGDGQPFIQDQFARGMVSVWDDSPEAVALASNLAVLYKDVIGRTWLDQLFPRFEGLARQFEQVLSHIHNRMYYKPCPDTQHPTRSSYTFASATLVAASHHASWDAAEQACTTEDSCIGYGTDNKLVNPNSTLSIKTYTANRSLPAWGSSAASAMTLTWMCTTPKVGHVTSSNSSSESSFNSFFGAVKYRHEIRATEAVAPVISKAAKPTTQEPPSSSGSGLSMAWTVVIVVSGVAVLGAFTGWSVVTIRKRFNQHRPEDVYQSPRMIPAHLEAQAEEHSEYQTHDELLEEPVDI